MHDVVLIGTVGAIMVTTAAAIIGLVAINRLHRRVGEMATTINAMRYDLIKLGATSVTPEPQKGRRRGHLLLIPGGATAIAAITASIAWARHQSRHHPVVAAGTVAATLAATAALLQPALVANSQGNPTHLPEAGSAAEAPATQPPDDKPEREQVDIEPSPAETSPSANSPTEQPQQQSATTGPTAPPTPTDKAQPTPEPAPATTPAEPPLLPPSEEPQPTTPPAPEPTPEPTTPPPPDGDTEDPDEDQDDDAGRSLLCLDLDLPPLLALDLCLL